jgi:endoglucanase
MDLAAAALARPRVRVNQVGYPIGGPKAATVLTDATAPIPFVVVGAGRPVWRGLSSPGPLPVLDFSGCRATGTFVVEAGGFASHPFLIAGDPYAGLLGDALRFFYAQRSGIAVDDAVLPGYGRPAGHAGVPPNQGDTDVDGLDLSGGWYDAGDHGKYVTSGALPASMLLAAHERYPGLPRPPGPSLLDEARWQLDWLLRMQVPPGRPHAGLAYHRLHDDVWTALPMWPHLDPVRRVLHPPSTTAGLHLAAAAAHAARLEPAYLPAARAAWEAAVREPTLLAPDDAGGRGGGAYPDADPTDDHYWAAAELYLTTGEARFREALLRSPRHTAPLGAVEWDDLTAYARIELALATDLPGVRDSVVARADELLAVQAGQPYGQPYAPADGWDWGSVGRILGLLLILAAAHRLTGAARFRDGLLGGLDYVFGRNPVGLSYVTGWGTESAHRQRSRHFANALDPSFPPPPRGSVAGGPASKDYPGWPRDPRFAGLPDQLCYVDEPDSETTNDVCIRWNAPLVLLAAHLSADAGAASSAEKSGSAASGG